MSLVYRDMTNLHTLVRAGQLLYGENWQMPIGRALGKYHPSGPRDTLDPRLVRRWYAEDRPVPDWVPKALVKVIVDQAKAHEKEAERLRKAIHLIQFKGEILDLSEFEDCLDS